MNKSESLTELAQSLALAQGEMSNPEKNAKNPFFKSSYADLSEVINVTKPVLATHGLSVLQLPAFENNTVSVETILLHESGEFISSIMSVPVSKIDPQSVGAATTYCRRYALAAICGVAQEDSDAEMAMDRTNAQPAEPYVSNDKPWYNDFAKQQGLMLKKIESGEESASEILSKIREKFKVSKEIAGKILALSGPEVNGIDYSALDGE